MPTGWTVLTPSVVAQRAITRTEEVDKLSARASSPVYGAPPLNLSTACDNSFRTPAAATNAVTRVIEGNTCNGYQPAAGRPEARAAIAQYWTKHFLGSHEAHFNAESVVLTCGASEGFLLALLALCEEGDNILVPSPGSPLYTTDCVFHGIEPRCYRCLPDRDWEIDLDHLRQLADGRTRAILMNNPSNPCGSNFSLEHVRQLLATCEQLKLPLIADEIYAGIVFSGAAFTSVADLDTPVPRFVISGLSQRFCVPGWRLGWLILVDRDGVASEVMSGVHNLCSISLGPNAAVQAAVPDVLSNTPEAFFTNTVQTLESNALLLTTRLASCPGLSCTKPQGGAFAVVKLHVEGFRDITTDVEFCKKLESEENVQVAIGSSFGLPDHIGVTTSCQEATLAKAVARIQAFCERHQSK